MILNMLLPESTILLVVPSPQSSNIAVLPSFTWIEGKLRRFVGIAADVPKKVIIILNVHSNFCMFRDLLFQRRTHFFDTDNRRIFGNPVVQ